MLQSEEYDRVSRAHFPKSYACPEGMCFGRSDGLFPPAELAASLGSEYEAQCRRLCYRPYPEWRAVHSGLTELRDLL